MAPLASVSAAIGNTPLVRLSCFSQVAGTQLLAKLEGLNPGGSVKDRVALAMVEDAEREGRLRPGATLVEPTSGNTGIALAMIAAARGYRLCLTMPETMSTERQALLRNLGAEVVLTPGALMNAAVEQAELLAASIPGAVMLRQFDNPANPAAHERGTGPELWRDTGGDLDVFIAGVGTGGTISGVARFWKARRPELHVVAVEPRKAAVLSGQKPGAHGLQGLGAGFIPRVLDRTLVDEVLAVDEDEAIEAARTLARHEGLLVGISSGAALAAAIQVAARPGPPRRIAVVLPDLAERYASTPYFRALGGSA